MNSIIQNLAKTVLGQVLGQNQNTAGLNNLIGAIGGGQNADQLIQGALNMIAPADGSMGAAGGLQNLISKFQQSGLDDVVASWVGTGANKAISGEQIQQVLGAEQIQQFAQQVGVNAEEAPNQLAQILPELINQLTPNGAVDNNIIGQVLGALAGGANKAA